MAHASVEARPQPGHHALPDAPGTAQAATERAMRIVVLVWSAAWIVLMAVFEGVDQQPRARAQLGDAGGPRDRLGRRGARPAARRHGVYVAVARRHRAGAGRAHPAARAVVAVERAASPGPTSPPSRCGFLVAGTRGRLGVVAHRRDAAAHPHHARLVGRRRWHSRGTAIVAAAAYALADGMAAHVAASRCGAQARDTDAAADAPRGRARRAGRARGGGARVRARLARAARHRAQHARRAAPRGRPRRDTTRSARAARTTCASCATCATTLRRHRRHRRQRRRARAARSPRAAPCSRSSVDVRSRITTTTTIPTAVADAVAGVRGGADQRGQALRRARRRAQPRLGRRAASRCACTTTAAAGRASSRPTTG